MNNIQTNFINFSNIKVILILILDKQKNKFKVIFSTSQNNINNQKNISVISKKYYLSASQSKWLVSVFNSNSDSPNFVTFSEQKTIKYFGIFWSVDFMKIERYQGFISSCILLIYGLLTKAFQIIDSILLFCIFLNT